MSEGLEGMKDNTRLVWSLTCAEGNDVAAMGGGKKLKGRKGGLPSLPQPSPQAVASRTSVLPAHTMLTP